MTGTSPALVEFAPAKVNLWLHVTGKRDDGYHLLDSLVAFADVGDRLTGSLSDTIALTVTGPFAGALQNEDDNLVSRAAQMLASQCGVNAGARLILEKNLPVASGIGGGSADAAAALRLCSRLWDVALSPDELREIALDLGADVPVCLESRTTRMSGIGDILRDPPRAVPPLHAVLVNPLTPVSTAAVFRALAGQHTPAHGEIGPTAFEWIAAAGNDLQDPALTLAPDIADVLAALAAQSGCRLSRMSGSGATCFGIFNSAAHAADAAAQLQLRYPGWWIAPCRFGSELPAQA